MTQHTTKQSNCESPSSKVRMRILLPLNEKIREALRIAKSEYYCGWTKEIVADRGISLSGVQNLQNAGELPIHRRAPSPPRRYQGKPLLHRARTTHQILKPSAELQPGTAPPKNPENAKRLASRNVKRLLPGEKHALRGVVPTM